MVLQKLVLIQWEIRQFLQTVEGLVRLEMLMEVVEVDLEDEEAMVLYLEEIVMVVEGEDMEEMAEMQC